MTPFSASGSLLVLCLMGWGVILMLCLFLALMRAFFSCVQRRYNGEAVIRRSGEDRRGENYRTMSPERQEEIDNLRKNALLRYMRRFTLVSVHCLCYEQRWTAAPFWVSAAHTHSFTTYDTYIDIRRRTFDMLLWITDWYNSLNIREWRSWQWERHIRRILPRYGREQWHRGRE